MTASKSTESAALDLSTMQGTSRREFEERAKAERETLHHQDGRSLRKRSRTKNLSLKVKPETVHTLHRIVSVEGGTMTDIVERAIALYDAQLRGAK